MSQDELSDLARTVIDANKYMAGAPGTVEAVYMIGRADELTGGELERGIELFDRVSEIRSAALASTDASKWRSSVVRCCAMSGRAAGRRAARGLRRRPPTGGSPVAGPGTTPRLRPFP
jgi:hypothetical protein